MSDTYKESPASRRSFLRTGGAAAVGSGLLAKSMMATPVDQPTAGDIAILQFLAAVELVESDVWTQYSELAINNPGFNQGLTNIDGSLPRYNHDIQRDEMSHASFINAYLVSVGQQPTNLDPYRTILMPPVQGADSVGHIANLTNLTVDTSWYTKYRTPENPDFGSMPAQFVNIMNQPAIPLTDGLSDSKLQAIANTATFHSPSIEQGGASLYAYFLRKATSVSVVGLLASILPVEAIHFTGFHKSIETMPGVSVDGVTFPDIRRNPVVGRGIFPVPCPFLSPDLPDIAIVRPGTQQNAGAVYLVNALTSSGLFTGQSEEFSNVVMQLAVAADAAQRGM